MTESKFKPEEILKYWLDFTDQDLQDNQQGRISPYQISILRYELGLSISFGVLSLIGAIAVMIWATRQNIGSLTIIVIVLIICLVRFLLSVLRCRRLLTDIGDKYAAPIEGRISLGALWYRHGSAMFPYIKIQDLRFYTNKELVQSLKNYGSYCLYYAPRSKVWLSVEALE